MANGLHEKKPIDTEQLIFDTNNPRLVGEHITDSSSDYQIIKSLSEGADIAELVISILENTFVDFEPIVVVQADKNNYRVLEGNRRLAAIRLIEDQELAQQLETDINYSIKRPVPEIVLKSIESIPAIIVDDEKDAQSYIGFKHINGPHKWSSFAKAKFVTKWFKAGTSIDDIARKVGDKNQTVRDLIAGMLVLEQAEEHELFEVKDRTKRGVFGFSHLYTALNRKEYRDYLGLGRNWTEHLSPDPIQPEKLPNLKTVLQYMYGSKKDNIESVIKSQNPDLKSLGEVLVNPVALQVLKNSNELRSALEETEEKSAVFERALISANSSLQKAFSNIAGYDGNESMLKTAKQMQKTISFLVTNMESSSK